jgi:chorismate-pyruvate lyase
MSIKKVVILCKENIPVFVSMETLIHFSNIYKIVIEDKIEKINVENIDARTLNLIIEYTKLMNINEINITQEFIDKLEDSVLYDVTIASKMLGFHKLISHVGIKIREMINK